MGPRLDNRGWAGKRGKGDAITDLLQWVHGWITVVGREGLEDYKIRRLALQWVHGWITVVGQGWQGRQRSAD